MSTMTLYNVVCLLKTVKVIISFIQAKGVKEKCHVISHDLQPIPSNAGAAPTAPQSA
jgi:hypothetical protein